MQGLLIKAITAAHTQSMTDMQPKLQSSFDRMRYLEKTFKDVPQHVTDHLDTTVPQVIASAVDRTLPTTLATVLQESLSPTIKKVMDDTISEDPQFPDMHTSTHPSLIYVPVRIQA